MSVVALGDNYFITTPRLTGVDARKAHDVHEAEQVIEEDLKSSLSQNIFVT
jgi:hypothetical protein